MTVTYCPEDNKIRLYVGRVPRDEYERLRKAGYASTPKQDCDFVATWTPGREDIAREYLADDEDIGDEDYSPQERAADRAERFDSYRSKRTAEAVGHADAFERADAVAGSQNVRHAARQARRRDRDGRRAVSQWSKAEYWQERTAGVIASAIYKSTARVRRGRILEIEKQIRRIEADNKPNESGGRCSVYWDAKHGRWMVYVGARRGGSWRSVESLRAMGPRTERWLAHLQNRLTYERAMIAADGGMAQDEEMVAGGWIGEHQIERVNRSPKTKRVTSVSVWGVHAWKRGDDGQPLQCLMAVDLGRLGEGHYRPPTDQDLADLKARKAARKAASTAPAKPKTINPTPEDAARLQSLLNAAEDRRYPSDRRYTGSTIHEMRQDEYSEQSKGAYARCEIIGVDAHGRPTRDKNDDRVMFRVRVDRHGDGDRYPNCASRVVVLRNKPQKPLPFGEMKAEADRIDAQHAAEEAEVWPEIVSVIQRCNRWGWRDDTDLVRKARIAVRAGWAYWQNGLHWTSEGHAEAKAAGLLDEVTA